MKEKFIPKCSICNKQMKNAYDITSKEISLYLWETSCEHFKDLKLSIG